MTESTAALFDRLDAITVDQLRAGGGSKWSRYPDYLGAWIAEMDFGIAPPITAALHEHVASGQFGYTPFAAKDELARAFTRFTAHRYGWALDPQTVRPAPDVLAVLGAMIDHFSTPDSPVIVPTPGYMPFFTLPGVHGRRVIQVPLVQDGRRWVYDLDALAAAFDEGGEILVLCNPHNPVGQVLTRTELLAIADIVDAKGGRVFADEIHAPVVFEGTHIPYATLHERAAAHSITATSCSKGFNLPGLKCAQAVLTNPADLAHWRRTCWEVEDGASRPGLVANIAAYDDGEAWLAGILLYLDRNRRALADALADSPVGYIPPQGTYLAMLDFRDTDLGVDPAARLTAEAGVYLTPGPALGEAGRGFARINIATPRPVLLDIAERIVRVAESAMAGASTTRQ